jgi:hypothetical protein
MRTLTRVTGNDESTSITGRDDLHPCLLSYFHLSIAARANKELMTALRSISITSEKDIHLNLKSCPLQRTREKGGVLLMMQLQERKTQTGTKGVAGSLQNHNQRALA